MVIEEAFPGEGKKLSELERLCFSAPLPEEMLERLISSPDFIILCAREGEEVLGYGGFQFVLDEGYILNIAVFPEHRRKNVGRGIMNALENKAKEKQLAFLTLEVREHNGAAISLYTKEGYNEVGRRRGYYTQPSEDAIIMTKFF
ncbi:MAG: ribosomal protein S18-alanine N-acetyltransferase [Oscillospiraceae bacterium]|nr:ribosomal protein S18-alanine N-acetyltransferase [Oscillospiraceae bacterium]